MNSINFLKSLLILTCNCIIIPQLLSAQNVGIGISTPVYKLDVRNGSINTDSVYRIDGNTVLSVKGFGNTFTGRYSGTDNTTGMYNTATGNTALSNNTIGIANTANGAFSLVVNTVGSYNVANGYLALNGNTAGNYNTANGVGSLFLNETGSYNTANGYHTLYNNNTGVYNTASGVQALLSNTGGSYNTASGVEALKNNDLGNFNTAHGYLALFSNYGGVENTAVGNRALFSNLYGGANTAIGSEALTSNLGSYNIGIGYGADVNPGGISNVIAIGSNLTVFASNTARFGNSATISYGGWAGWTNVSDGRFKKDIRENVPGLDFINKLRPVTYTLDARRLDEFYNKNDKNKKPLSNEIKAVFESALREKEKIVYTGFIAQEVEATAKEMGFDFSGVDAAKNENDTYGLRYAEFVVPLVKAVQEQQAMIKALEKQNELLQKRIALLENKK